MMSGAAAGFPSEMFEIDSNVGHTRRFSRMQLPLLPLPVAAILVVVLHPFAIFLLRSMFFCWMGLSWDCHVFYAPPFSLLRAEI